MDGRGLPLTIVLTPGQAGDSPALPELLAELRIPRLGAGRPRTTPHALRADKAYAGAKTRTMLQARGIKVVIPEKSDAIARRKAKGSAGGRPLDFDAKDYKMFEEQLLKNGGKRSGRGIENKEEALMLLIRKFKKLTSARGGD